MMKQPLSALSSADKSPRTHRLWARYCNALLGTWLFASAFAWSHSPAARANTWIVGLLVLVSSLLGSSLVPLRWTNTLLSIWLFITTLAFQHTVRFTLWHDALIAAAVFALSLIPNDRPDAA